MNTFIPILGELGSFGWLLGLMFGLLLPLYFLISIIPVTIGMTMTFAKAGQPFGAALVPVYNMIVLLRVAGLPWYGILPILIPFFGIIAAGVIPVEFLDGAADTARVELIVEAEIVGMIAFPLWITWVHHHISRRFGRGIGFTLGLTLLAPIFWLILGFGSAKYLGEKPAQD
jgi:hypothetical protein